MRYMNDIIILQYILLFFRDETERDIDFGEGTGSTTREGIQDVVVSGRGVFGECQVTDDIVGVDEQIDLGTVAGEDGSRKDKVVLQDELRRRLEVPGAFENRGGTFHCKVFSLG